MGSLKVIEYKGKPKYHFVDTPDFSNTIDRIKYLGEENNRIRNGWMGLSGLHYFYLTKTKLHDPTTGDIYHPIFRMVDKEIIEQYLWCKNHVLQEEGFPPDSDNHPVIIDGKTIPDPYDLIIVKPRRLALTSIFGAGVSMYNAIISEGCSQGLTSCDSKRLTDLVNDKVFYSRESCVENGLLSDKFRWNQEFLQFPFQKNGETKLSNIWLLDTAKDDKAAASPEGNGFIMFMLDEWFLHPRANKVKLSVTATLLDRFKRKVGVMIQGGSCNAMTGGAIQKLKETLEEIKDPSSKTKFLFIEGWKGQIIDEWGFDKEDEARTKKQKDREKYRKANDWQGLQNEIKSFPNDLKELVTVVESDYFSPKIVFNINTGLQSSFNNEPLQCNLLNHHGRVFTDDKLLEQQGLSYPEGNRYPYLIYKDRVPYHIYGTAGDPIDFMGANPKGSFFSQVVKDFSSNEYVASLEFRTTDPELGYNLWYNLMLYYGIRPGMCLMEKNRLGSLLSMCKLNKTLNLLAFDPDKKHPSGDDDRGYHKDQYTMPKLMNFAKMYLETNTIPFLRFNQNFMGYQENTEVKKNDICDAVLGCEFLHNSLFVAPKDESERRTKMVPYEVRDQQGYITTKYKQVPLKRQL